MTNKPTHIAYIVTDAKEGSEKKANWREVGILFPHEKGDGFNLLIHPGISVSGKVVIRERKESEAAA
ncbi:MAG TPA: hypothetical protein VFV38_09920 [Ktedonobacteraceae bacterium]|nr:hypothetical protein [Ktedonobacteraceae bacterium]